MVAQITLQEALGFSAVALLLGLITIRWQLALRRSMLSMIDGGENYEAHPAFWAPFVLVGEGSR